METPRLLLEQLLFHPGSDFTLLCKNNEGTETIHYQDVLVAGGRRRSRCLHATFISSKTIARADAAADKRRTAGTEREAKRPSRN